MLYAIQNSYINELHADTKAVACNVELKSNPIVCKNCGVNTKI